MSRLSHVTPRTATIVVAAWIAVSGAALTAWIVAQARSFERAFTDAGPSLGATSVAIDVDLVGAWPQLVVLYAVIVALPAVAFWVLWRKSRRGTMTA